MLLTRVVYARMLLTRVVPVRATYPGGTCPCYIPGWCICPDTSQVVYMPGYLSGGVHTRLVPQSGVHTRVGTSEWCICPSAPRSLGECGPFCSPVLWENVEVMR